MLKDKKIRSLKDKDLVSEALITSVFLSLSGGYMDAYTYFGRDKVFSNGQTGNMVIMGYNILSGDFNIALRYLIPILAFAVGIFLTEFIKDRIKIRFLYWRQAIIGIEILILFLVGFIPPELNRLATMLVSFVCALQVEAFRKIRGYDYASTMCLGNLRSGMEALAHYSKNGEKAYLKKAVHYFSIIVIFTLGAALGGILTVKFGIYAIWGSCLFLAFSFFIFF